MASQRIAIQGPPDVERARREARRLAETQGFSREDAECVALAVSELATNLVRYARSGVITLSPVEGPSGRGVEVESADRGPGIADLPQAMRDGYSSGRGLGDGLPAARRLMDEFQIESGDAGTRVVARKWPRR